MKLIPKFQHEGKFYRHNTSTNTRHEVTTDEQGNPTEIGITQFRPLNDFEDRDRRNWERLHNRKMSDIDYRYWQQNMHKANQRDIELGTKGAGAVMTLASLLSGTASSGMNPLLDAGNIAGYANALGFISADPFNLNTYRSPEVTTAMIPFLFGGINGLPKFVLKNGQSTSSFRDVPLDEQAAYLLSHPDASISHPVLTQQIQDNPQLKAVVEDMAEGAIPQFTFAKGTQTPLVSRDPLGKEPATHIGSFLAATDQGVTGTGLGEVGGIVGKPVEAPQLETFVGMQPIEGELFPRNGTYKFSTDEPWNAAQYSWFGHPDEVLDAILNNPTLTSAQKDYAVNLYRRIDALNAKYKVKNYAYKDPKNARYRDSDKKVNYSLYTHLINNPRGKQIVWDPADQQEYIQASEALADMAGSNLYGGIKRMVIPRIPAVSMQFGNYNKISATTPISALTTKGKQLLGGSQRYFSDFVPRTSKIDMNRVEAIMADLGIPSFRAVRINDPVLSTSYANRLFGVRFGMRDGGKLTYKK